MRFDDWTSLDKKAYDLMHGKSWMEKDQIIEELEKENETLRNKQGY